MKTTKMLAILGLVLIICLANGVMFPDVTRQTTAGGFPCPAYDSGWVELPWGGHTELVHGLGGNPENYVVDLQLHYPIGIEIKIGIHNRGHGGDKDTDWNSRGAYYRELNANSITVGSCDGSTYWTPEVRVRIWVYECEPVPPTGAFGYESGDRVRLLVDNPREATNLPAGTLGTVLCCDSDDPDLPILVSWDGWTGGYSGYNRDVFCDVPPGSYPNNSAYWMACDQIERASREGYFDGCGVLVREVEGFRSFHADAGGRYLLDNYYDFQVGDRIHVRGLSAFT